MTAQSRSIPSDMASLWRMNQQSLGNEETGIRAWFNFASRTQDHAAKFINGRWSKDTAALAQLGQSKTPVEALNVQMTYLTGAYADYLNEGQKIVGFFGDVVRETLSGMSAEQAPSTSGRSKHSPHRVAAH